MTPIQQQIREAAKAGRLVKEASDHARRLQTEAHKLKVAAEVAAEQGRR